MHWIKTKRQMVVANMLFESHKNKIDWTEWCFGLRTEKRVNTQTRRRFHFNWKPIRLCADEHTKRCLWATCECAIRLVCFSTYTYARPMCDLSIVCVLAFVSIPNPFACSCSCAWRLFRNVCLWHVDYIVDVCLSVFCEVVLWFSWPDTVAVV